MKFKWAGALAGALLLGGLALSQVAQAVYSTTGSLNHNGYCIGYGYADSAVVSVGTSKTGGTGPCYRKQDAYIYYNNGSVFDPMWTGYQTYDLYQAAGPEGICDYAYGTHYMSWTASDTGSPFGSTSAEDC